MSQILSKLGLNNNEHFGREMRRDGKEKNVTNLIAWLHQETSIRSCGKSNSVWGTKNTSPRKGLKRRKTTPQMAKKLMIIHVHLIVKQNIISLLVLSSRL